MNSEPWGGLACALLLACTGVACGHGTGSPDCVALPCPMPLAVTLTVTASGGGPVPDLTMTVTGATSAAGPCTAEESATTCAVPGTSGTYAIRLTAPGFQEKTVSVVVEGTNPPCGCPSVQTQRLSVVLAR